MKVKAEIGAMPLQAKDGWKHQKPGRGPDAFFLTALRWNNLADPLILDLAPP